MRNEEDSGSHGPDTPIRTAELIERKRDGRELSGRQIAGLVLGYAQGEVPDHQVAAFLMAVYFRGLSTAETFALTEAMVRSGETLDLAADVDRRVVDKHSTGGVGDKTTLAVGPIVAACGVPFGKLSGRGLGLLLPRRRVVERSLSWAARFRRLILNDERLPARLAGASFLGLAKLMLRRVAKFPIKVHDMQYPLDVASGTPQYSFS